VTEFVKLGLVKAFFLPLLTYCVGNLDLTVTCIRELDVCWNDSFRKIFGYKRHESVKLLLFRIAFRVYIRHTEMETSV